MAVIGTAGHVDHGKSTLIMALTGRDPDRWKEEKERGLTIDLGFAWMSVDGGPEIAFVDVPGHERFIKNMLAGVETIDGALFVVAADEGWMPQSEEHLAVLDLLGTTRGVVALTKADLVDDDLLELATLEVAERLAGTGMEDAPVIAVSAKSGAGIPDVRALLGRMADQIEVARIDGQPRLWVDRAFSISGAGTVVTGSLVGGALEVGDELEVWPVGEIGRIRSLHRHEQEQRRISAGSRCAVNIGGLERMAVHRGSLVAPPGSLVPTDSWLATLTTARYVEEPLTGRGAYHLHLGSGAWPVRIQPLSQAGLQGQGLALVKPEAPIPVRVGDRFILREVGRRSVVAGGRIIDPDSPTRSSDVRGHAETLLEILDLEPNDAATLLLNAKGFADPRRLTVWTGGRPEAGVITSSVAIAADFLAQLSNRTIELVTAFHAEHPLREGYPKATLASQLGSDLDVLAVIVDGNPLLRDDGSSIALSAFNAGLSPSQEVAWTNLQAILEAAGPAAPRLKDLALEREFLHVLVRERRIVRVSEDLVYLPETLESITTQLTELPPQFTVAEFRDALGLSRKFAVPLLEWLDAQGVTRRDGDTRSLRRSSSQ